MPVSVELQQAHERVTCAKRLACRLPASVGFRKAPRIEEISGVGFALELLGDGERGVTVGSVVGSGRRRVEGFEE